MTEQRDPSSSRDGSVPRRAAARRRAPYWRLFAASAAIAAGATVAFPPAPRLVWNASQSAPLGLYLVRPDAPLTHGDMVVAWPPPAARALASRRHYLPFNVPLVKRIAAGPGARVCAIGERIFIDGRSFVARRAADRRGRPLPRWIGCTTLRADQYLLVMAEVPDSFDGRYFGPVGRAAIVGKAVPLWVD